MDLERMTAKVRPRKGWEAIDLGVALVQEHAPALYKIWFLITLPVILPSVVIFKDYSVWPLIGFWFFIPILERPMLHFLSRELFGERLSVKACVGQFFHLSKIQWFASLTWRRLSFTRSLDLPLIQLEGLSGHQRSQRLKVIHSIGSGSAVWMTIFFVFLEISFYFAFLVLAYLFLPPQISDNIDLFEWLEFKNNTPTMDIIHNLVAYISISIVAPFFTACGFALYINQRTHLEAWDIELSFKRLAKRLSEQSEHQHVRLASWLVALGFVLSMLPAQPVYAAEEKAAKAEESVEHQTDTLVIDESFDHEKAQNLIEEIKKDEEFNQKDKTFRYERRKKSEEPNEVQTGSYSPWWYWFGQLFSVIIEFALWVVLAVVVIFLITRYQHLVTGLYLPKKAKKKRPQKLFGLDMNSETLPDKPWMVALKLLEEKAFREATSLLYRASLIWYIDHTPVVIKEGDTELECLAKVKPEASHQAASFMAQLTDNWRKLAYAHQVPPQETLQTLCESWPEVFRQSSEQQVTDGE